MDLSNQTNFVVLFGAPASGKSFLIRDLVYHFRSTANLIVVLTCSKFNSFFQSFIPAQYVHDGFNIEVVEKLLVVAKELKKLESGNRILLVLDDLQNSLWTHPTMLMLINVHRHYNIDVIISAQYVKALTPNIRSNATLCFIFKQTDKNAIEGIYDSFNYGMDKTEFIAMLSQVVREPYRVLVVNKLNKDQPFSSFRASERKFMYKAHVNEPDKEKKKPTSNI